MFSAQTRMASPCAPSKIVPHSSTTPSLTATSISATGAHDCRSNSASNCWRIAVSVSAEGGERTHEVGAADDADDLRAAHYRQALDAAVLHGRHDLVERGVLGDRD